MRKLTSDEERAISDMLIERCMKRALAKSVVEKTLCGMTEREILEMRQQRDRLLEALAEIREIYAGSEGIPVGETAAEAYVVQLIEQMFRVAAEALANREGQ